MSFVFISFTNLILVLILVLYDSLFIDLFMLGVWKPRFLNIPEDVTLKSMKYHIKKTFILGWIIVVPLIMFGSAIYILFFK